MGLRPCNDKEREDNMGLVHSENLALTPSKFKRLSIQRLNTISDYLAIVYVKLEEKDPDYRALAGDMEALKLAVGQVGYSFREVSDFLDSIKQKIEQETV